jgi:nucleoside-diphosphate-sugar epimerase
MSRHRTPGKASKREKWKFQPLHVLGEMNKNIACSTEKAMNELGYEPVHSVRAGMRESVRFCRERGRYDLKR